MSQKSASSGRRDLLNSPIGNTLKSMTLPMLVGMVMMMSFGLVDTYFIGLLGTDELAAISFTFPVTFTLISLHIGLGIGTSAVIGRFLGNNSHSEAQLSGTGALMLAFVLAAVLAFVGVITIDPIFTLLGANERLLSYIHEYMVVWLSLIHI